MTKVMRDRESRVPSRGWLGARDTSRGARARHRAHAPSHAVSSGPKIIALHTNRLSSLCGLALQPSGGSVLIALRSDCSLSTAAVCWCAAPAITPAVQKARTVVKHSRLKRRDDVAKGSLRESMRVERVFSIKIARRASSNGERASRRSSMWRSRHVSSVPRREDLSRGGTRKPDSDFPAKRNCRRHPARFTTNRGV